MERQELNEDLYVILESLHARVEALEGFFSKIVQKVKGDDMSPPAVLAHLRAAFPGISVKVLNNKLMGYTVQLSVNGHLFMLSIAGESLMSYTWYFMKDSSFDPSRNKAVSLVGRIAAEVSSYKQLDDHIKKNSI